MSIEVFEDRPEDRLSNKRVGTANSSQDVFANSLNTKVSSSAMTEAPSLA